MRLSLLGLLLLTAGVILIPSETPSTLSISPVVAQTQAELKAEADRLLQLGIQQHQADEHQAAIQTLQQALVLYRKIQDRESEGIALLVLGVSQSLLVHLISWC